MAQVEKLGEYSFKLEFDKEEEKMKVLEGGPWRHKGDALIVVHYDGLTRPSEVYIDAITVWVRLYDLPPVMMKQVVARQLSAELGEFIKMDSRFPGYMRVRLLFPLKKAQAQQLKIKIREGGSCSSRLSMRKYHTSASYVAA
jgi:hypothetical protein